MSKTKNAKKSAVKASGNTKAKAAPTKKSRAKKPEQAPALVESTPLADPCANGHQWDADGEGEFCNVCKADRKVIEQPQKKPVRNKKASQPQDKKLSAIDAAAQLLATAAEPMNTKEMIDAMASQGLWKSPGGQTPHATLYSAILREITTKGKDARFTKSERGKFASTTK